MATSKTPIRTVYDNSNSPIGLAEFQTGEVVPVIHGGTGANTVAEAKLNLSLTDSNIRSLISVSGGGSYNNSTGVITINSTDLTPYATITHVTNEISNVVGAAPGVLDTLNELAAAINDDASFYTTINNSIGASRNQANAAYDRANVAVTYAGSAFDKANTLIATVAGVSSTSISNTNLLDGIKSVDGSSSGLDSDLLDGQDGSYYLDWTNVTNKPDPTITVQLTGDVSGSASATLSDLGSNTITISTTIQNNSIVLGTDTTGDYVQNVIPGTGIVITGSVGESRDATITLDTSGVSASTYGGASKVPVLTIDQYGRITSAANVNVAGVTNFTASGNTFTISTADGGSFSASIPDGVDIVSPDLLGTPTAPTASAGTNTTQIATTAFVRTEVANLVDSAPTALDTLNELAAALGDDANFATTTATSIGSARNQANAAYDRANVAVTYAGSAFDKANTLVATVAGVSSTSISNSQLLSGILTVDGSGSNLDADLLDGQQGSYYTNADNLSSGTLNTSRLATSGVTAATYGNAIFVPSIVVDQYGRVTSASNVSIGTVIVDDTSTNATRYLTFTSNTSGSVTLENVSSTKLTFNPSSGLLTSTDYNSSSDKRLKKEVKTIQSALDKVNDLRGVSFVWKEGNQKSFGLIAQEVEKVLPEVVSTDESGYLGIRYNNIIGILVEAIKEQQKQIDELKSKL